MSIVEMGCYSMLGRETTTLVGMEQSLGLPAKTLVEVPNPSLLCGKIPVSGQHWYSSGDWSILSLCSLPLASPLGRYEFLDIVLEESGRR